MYCLLSLEAEHSSPEAEHWSPGARYQTHCLSAAVGHPTSLPAGCSTREGSESVLDLSTSDRRRKTSEFRVGYSVTVHRLTKLPRRAGVAWRLMVRL